MVQESALIPVVDLLNELKIPYMLIGGIALNYYSVPRLTHDADILVEMKPELAGTLAQRLRFSRRVPGRVFGLGVFLSTPEDLILTKLVWFKKSDSQKHYLDALGLYRAQRDELQRDYLDNEASELSVAGLLSQLERDSEAAQGRRP